jgi:NAD(P)-dependent dehydrogenase (short-subunit alcohol dehydrogenase family)
MSTWFITGTSSGLGAALADRALAAGHQVVATARDTSPLEHLSSTYQHAVLTATLDVTDQRSIAVAVQDAERRFGGIDVLVNNAGYGYTAAVEEGEPEKVARLFATNFFGPVDLIRAALPGMRARGSGSIVNVSSIGARVNIAGGGYYSAAKAALGGLSGSLRREVEPLGIRVMVVEPGSFRTDFRGRSADRSDLRIDSYDKALGRVGDRSLGPQRGDPAKAAAAIVEAVEDPDPPKLLLLGTDALAGYRVAADDDARDVARFEHLARSTDADS